MGLGNRKISRDPESKNKPEVPVGTAIARREDHQREASPLTSSLLHLLLLLLGLLTPPISSASWGNHPLQNLV